MLAEDDVQDDDPEDDHASIHADSLSAPRSGCWFEVYSTATGLVGQQDCQPCEHRTAGKKQRVLKPEDEVENRQSKVNGRHLNNSFLVAFDRLDLTVPF